VRLSAISGTEVAVAISEIAEVSEIVAVLEIGVVSATAAVSVTEAELAIIAAA
jgi:hypothetical protein